jgi:hypothetical protein
MASLKNSQAFCVLNSVVALFFQTKKNGENQHNFTSYNLLMVKKLF